MQLFTKNKPIEILDDHLFSSALLIKVFAICNLEKINNQYFIRAKSFRKIYYYCREIGFKNTVLKIISRSREKTRNEKYFSIGIGEVVKSTTAKFQSEKIVYFIASNHPACPERVVIDEKLVFLTDDQSHPLISKNHIVWLKKFYLEKWWATLLSWSPYSGLPISDLENIAVSEKIKQFWKSVSIKPENNIALRKATAISEVRIAKKKDGKKANKTAVLFGYGNYAKTIILPNLHKSITVSAIHEIDPAQLIPLKKNMSYDTKPYPRDEKYDVYLIAGYHHTHVDIAIAGLQNGADVIVEKPLMTHRKDLEKLICAMQQSSSELYACFQRRYHRFNDYVRQDFKLNVGDPISYYAIIYEETLPELHWYRWPNSRSAIISNGCHWIDHFLFLNNFSPVFTAFARKMQSGEIVIIVELANGATLSLTLSHLGSARIGMQEYIELRSGGNTAKIRNGNYYQSENASRIIRRSKINKYEAYKKMYHLISKNIVDKKSPRLSDDWKKVEMASSLILSLDEQLQ